MHSKAKLLDAVLILERKIKDLDSTIQLDKTDATDSEEGFQRRLGNLQESLDETLAAIAKLQRTQSLIESEMARMRTARALGSSIVDRRLTERSEHEKALKRVRIALLQVELDELSNE